MKTNQIIKSLTVLAIMATVLSGTNLSKRATAYAQNRPPGGLREILTRNSSGR